MTAEPVAEGLVFPEGPAVLDDGSVAFVEVNRSQVSVWEPGRGVRRLAYTGGGPNACCLGSDGHLYVTQNGGVVGAWRADELRPGSIQRVTMDGKVEIVATEVGGIALRQPNDLAWGPDGRLYFTDPGIWNPGGEPDPGRIFALGPDGSGELLAELGGVFPNGIAVEPDGSVVWAETMPRRLVRRRGDGTTEVVHELADERALPDGFAIAADGSFYVAVLFAGGVTVVGRDGGERARLAAGTITSNCAFDGRFLYVTDGGPNSVGEGIVPGDVGVLWRVETDVAGSEPLRGRLL